MSKVNGKITIDPGQCKGFGLYIWACPQKSIKIFDQAARRGIRVAFCSENAKCTGRRFCYIVCPDTVTAVYEESTAEEPFG